MDADAPDEGPVAGEVWVIAGIAPDEVRWRVRLRVSSSDVGRVRRQLAALGRPLIKTGNKHLDLGASDLADAAEVAAAASLLDGVAAVKRNEIRRPRSVRQRVARDYFRTSDGPRYGYGLDSRPVLKADMAAAIRVTPEVAQLLRATGGKLYVWADKGGVKHVSVDPPARPITFTTFYRDDDFELLQDETITPPRFWDVRLQPFPRRSHVDVFWNGRPGYTAN